MNKRVLSRKTSRGAAPKRQVLQRSSVRKYAGNAVESIRGMEENPALFTFGNYDVQSAPSLEEAISKAEAALAAGKTRAAASYAVDIADMISEVPYHQKMPGGAQYELVERAQAVAERAIDALRAYVENAVR